MGHPIINQGKVTGAIDTQENVFINLSSNATRYLGWSSGGADGALCSSSDRMCEIFSSP